MQERETACGPFLFLLQAKGIEVTEREFDLLVRCRKRDRRAQNAFYQEHFAYLMKIALRYAINRDQAVEWVNLGFARIFLQLDKFNTDLALRPWMAAVLRNIVLDELRKESRHRKRTAEPDVEAYRELAGDDAPLGQGEEFEEQVRLALEQLPPMTRRVFTLFAIDGFRHKEIAEMLRIPEGTSHWHFSVAKSHLRKELKTNWIDA